MKKTIQTEVRYERQIDISEPDRDSEFTKKAIEKFGILIKTFPESNFSKDAKFKIQFLEIK